MMGPVAISLNDTFFHILFSGKNEILPRSCIAWRQTANCDFQSFREPYNDRECHQKIRVDWSGYCECIAGTSADNITFYTLLADCDRDEEFTCEDGCQLLTASPTFVPTASPNLQPTFYPTLAHENHNYLPSFRISDLSVSIIACFI
jgi:hypothetical protein